MQRGMNKTRIRARLVNALPGTGVMDWVQEEQSPKHAALITHTQHMIGLQSTDRSYSLWALCSVLGVVV